MNDVRLEHPPSEELAAFAVGELGAERSAVIEAHILECTHCWQALEQVPAGRLAELLQPARASDSKSAGSGSIETVIEPTAESSNVATVQGPPELIDHPRYRIVAKLGEGGMGVVYKAEHLVMDRPVALKVISKNLMASSTAVERFAREVKAAARLSHPNIVAAYDADHSGSLHFLVMEFVEGNSLHRLVQERGPLPVDMACEYARQAALGLQHAFERGMVHRDIKPHNLIVTADCRVKILDFGLARLVSQVRPAGSLTDTGYLMGTPDYIAPEQARDSHRADIRADIYSLGCTLFYLLIGKPPFPDGTVVQKLAAHVKKPPPPVNELRADVPAPVAHVVARMMAKEPAERYQTPADLAQALTSVLEARSATSSRPRGVRSKRRRYVLGALLIGITSVIAILIHRTWLGDSAGVDSVDALRPVEAAKGANHAELLTLRQLPGRVGGLAFSPDGAYLASAGNGATINIWNAQTGAMVRTIDSEMTALCSMVYVDSERLAYAGGHLAAKVSNVSDGRVALTLIGHNSTLDGLAVSADGKWLASSSEDATVRIWNAADGLEVRTLRGHARPVYGICFSPDGTLLASASNDSTVRLWETTTGHARVLRGHRNWVIDVAFSPDGRRLASASEDRSIKLWDTATGDELLNVRGHAGGVTCVRSSPSGAYLVSASRDNTVKIWDSSTGKCVVTLSGHTDLVHGLAISRDGQRLASASEDGTVKLWDLRLIEKYWLKDKGWK